MRGRVARLRHQPERPETVADVPGPAPAAWEPCSLDLVGRAVAGDFDGAAEAAFGLLASPLVPELVGDVRNHHALRPRLLGVVTGLLRCHVPADAGSLGAGKGGLDQEQIGVPGDLDQLVAGAR